MGGGGSRLREKGHLVGPEPPSLVRRRCTHGTDPCMPLAIDMYIISINVFRVNMHSCTRA